jgi:2-phospho-L-lactate guanylyltransferase
MCKTRLEQSLGERERLRLVRTMLRHVLDTAARVPGVDRVAVISNERDDVRDDIPIFPDRGAGLNAALEDARRSVAGAGADMLVVLPADLPLLAANDVTRLIEGVVRTGCAIAPDRWRIGTNGLGLLTSATFPFAFGEESFARHLRTMSRLGIDPTLVETRTLGFDVDWSADLAEFAGQRGQRRGARS